MSMLAEPRRKQKWSVDPRNSAWSNDESKFGQKMLERMGWSKGKGLGKSEQGATEHIKVKVKNNSLGLGNTVYNEDNWIAHQDDFNQLLAELNSCHGQNSGEEPTQDQTQGFSLEEKSKTSKKRVHYMKFTKGKDLSNRSETDLACIFGKRSKRTKDQDEASSEDSQEEKELCTNDEGGPAKSSEADLITVTSALTMQEYFAQRMAQLKKGHSAGHSVSSSSPTASSAPRFTLASPQTTVNSTNTDDVDQSKKKKKKKKKERNTNEEEERVEELKQPSVVEEAVDVELGESGRKKQKKKKKNREMREKEEEQECSIPLAEHTPASVEDEKKRRREEKETASNSFLDSVGEDGTVHTVVDNEVSDKKRKKRKRKEQGEDQVDVEQKKPKKDRMKKNY